MTLPLWGQLQKAQDDPETIEEAINRIVTEHNDDAEAHTEEGQSLESHKTEPIIDHPARSIVGDKFSANHNLIFFKSADIGMFELFYGGSVTADRVWINIDYLNAGNSVTTVELNCPEFRYPDDGDAEIVFDCSYARTAGHADDALYMVFGDYYPGPPWGFGFEIGLTTITPFVRCEEYTIIGDPISRNTALETNYRAHFDGPGLSCTFFINNEVVEVMNLPEDEIFFERYFSFLMAKGSATTPRTGRINRLFLDYKMRF